MVITSKTRLGKRKLEIKEVRKENQLTTSKKHVTKCFAPTETSTKEKVSAPRKPETKSDLLDKMKLVEQLNDALLEEVKNNEEAIVALEKKEKKHIAAIKSLEERIEEAKCRQEFNPIGKTFDYRKKRATDLKENSRVTLANLFILFT